MKNQPFLLPVTGLVAGIIFYETVFADGYGFWLVALVYLLLLIFIGRKNLFSVVIILIFSTIGFILTSKSNHYEALNQKYIDEAVPIHLKIDETFRASEKYRKYSAVILFVDSTKVKNTKVLLYLKKSDNELFLNEEIWIYNKFQNLQKPLNPYQFDYSKYLERKGIHYTIFQNDSFLKVKEPTGFFYKASVFKKTIYQKMIDANYTKATADLTGAMFLGNRTEMDPEIENDFRRTGVVHLLAISGLHVMMIFQILMFLLKPIKFIRHGTQYRIIIGLILIWIFVAFTDFRPPVFRSGLMISIYYTTILLRRKPNIYHTLLLSALILLLYNPNFLFDPGFLLSFSAVFFIVYFNPIYNKIFRPKNQFVKRIYELTTTSVSAQAGTLPFSVFFFNQTSGLFLAGNIVMIPASFLMVAGSMFTVFLMTTGLHFEWWQQLFDFFINLCYSYVHLLSEYNNFVFDRLSLTLTEVILLVLGFLLLKLIYFKPQAQHLFVLFFLTFIFEGQRVFRLNQILNKEEIIVFHQNKGTVIGVRKAGLMDVYLSDIEDTVNVEKYIVRPYSIHQKIKKINFRDLNTTGKTFYEKTENHIVLNGKRLIIYSKETDSIIRPNDYLLIRNNLKPDSIFEKTQFVIDGSNYPDFANQIKSQEIINTRKDGALIIDAK